MISFRQFIGPQIDFALALEDKLRTLIDAPNFAFFFLKDKDIFGGSEGSRIIFAQLKKPDKDYPSKWGKDASFMGMNLSKMAHGEVGQEVFEKKDLGKIKIIDRDEAYEELKKQLKNKKPQQILVANGLSNNLKSEE